MRILKQNFEALGSVLGGAFINFLKPVVKALNVVIGKLREFAKVVSNSLGVIFGWKYEDSGGGVASDFEDAETASGGIADSTGKAAKNIEKIQKGLRSFDELKMLNIQDDNSSGSGSGGGGGGSSSGDSGGQWSKVDSMFKNYESELDTLYKLGEHIGSTLAETLRGIDWESIYESARGFGTGLADFLNGLISPELFGAVGSTIASALNTAIYAALSFGKTFDFYDFGLSIATGINELFETFDFASLADTLNTWADGITETIKGAIANINLVSVYEGITDFLENLDIKTIAIVLGAVTITKIAKLHIAEAVLSAIGTEISKQIAQSIASKIGVAIAADAGISTAIASGLVSIIPQVGVAFTAGISALFGNTAASASLAFISPIATAIAGIGSIISGLALSVTSFVSMWQNGFSILKEFIMVVGIALTAVGAIVLGAPALVTGVVAGIVASVATVAVVVHNNWDKIISHTSNLRNKVGDFFADLWDGVVAVWNKVADWFHDNVSEPITDIFDGFKLRVSQIFEGLWIIVQAVWIVVSGWFNNYVVTPIINFFSPIVTTISGFFYSTWNKIKSIWGNVSGWFNTTIITPLTNAFSTACDKIKSLFGAVWSAIKSGVAGAMNSVISKVESGVNGIVRGINSILNGFNKLVNLAAKITGTNWSGVSRLSTVSLPRVSAYKTGGFPEKSSLFWAGENGIPEMLGTVGGKPAVAGGVEITGISDTIRATSNEEVALLRQQNTLLQAILEKEFGITKDDIGRAAQSYANDYFMRTGREAYSF